MLLGVRNLLGLGLLMGAALACGGGGGGDNGRTIHGTLTLSDSDNFWSDGSPCSGQGGYDDISSGAQVVVKNEAGEIVATSRLEAGVGKDLRISLWELGVEAAEEEGRTPPPSPDLQDSDLLDLNLVQCEFAFEADVPASPFYSIEVSHRGEINYSYDDMVENDWTVGLTLGP